MQTLVESKWAVFGNVGIKEMLITHSYLGKFLFTRKYPFCRNSDEMCTVTSVLTVERGREGKACKGFCAWMCFTGVDWAPTHSAKSYSWNRDFQRGLKQQPLSWGLTELFRIENLSCREGNAQQRAGHKCQMKSRVHSKCHKKAEERQDLWGRSKLP